MADSAESLPDSDTLDILIIQEVVIKIYLPFVAKH